MNRFVLTTALTLAVAGPALASDQLARSIGVEPGVYTTAQLVQLRSAQEDRDWPRYNAIKREAADAGYTVSSSGMPSAGVLQIAESLGVDANEYSRAQLAELRAAVDENDRVRINAIKREVEAGGFTASSKSSPSAGHRQLAASLGVDPTAYSLSELAAMRDVRFSNGDNG